MDRRRFVKVGCIASASLMMQELDPLKVRADEASRVAPAIELHGPAEYKSSPLGMPGLFPGRVIEVRNPKSISRNRVSQPIVRDMLTTAMQDLTGEKSVPAAWAKFVEPTDVVGIKINPSGRRVARLLSCCARSSAQFNPLEFRRGTSSFTTDTRTRLMSAAIRRSCLRECAS
jgi:hypothetical protein